MAIRVRGLEDLECHQEEPLTGESDSREDKEMQHGIRMQGSGPQKLLAARAGEGTDSIEGRGGTVPGEAETTISRISHQQKQGQQEQGLSMGPGKECRSGPATTPAPHSTQIFYTIHQAYLGDTVIVTLRLSL